VEPGLFIYFQDSEEPVKLAPLRACSSTSTFSQDLPKFSYPWAPNPVVVVTFQAAEESRVEL
jgi:hypothetical protein